jgi:hypothetical protein
LAIPAYWFFSSIFSVSALSMNTSTAILFEVLVIGELLFDLFRLVGLVLDDDGAGVEFRRRQLQRVELLELSPWQPTRQSSSSWQ